MIVRFVRLVLMLAAAGALAAGEVDPGPPAQGLDVGQAANAVKNWVAPNPHQKPWSADIANLSSDDQMAQNRAVADLIRQGPPVLGDLAVLAQDRDTMLRVRVVLVAAGIGGQAPVPLLMSLGSDPEPRVREEAVLGLGRCSGEAAFTRLRQALDAPDANERAAGAQALGAIGDVRALALLGRLDAEGDDLARRDEAAALARIAGQSVAIPELARLIGDSRGAARDTCILAAGALSDPRLCPALVALAGGEAPIPTRLLAVRALALDGDSRAWRTLCDLAARAPEPSIADAAAGAMRMLAMTPGQGMAWAVWWRDHAATVPRLNERDQLLADLHDPAAPIDRQALARFSVAELAPLIDGALGGGAAWWPPRAFAAMRADSPARWSDELTRRLIASPDVNLRVALIMLVDQLGGPTCAANLAAAKSDADARRAREATLAASGHAAPDRGAESVALTVALERHGVR